MQPRESLSSRLGFLLLAAGCAIGLGNVWRFPYIVGKYGGGAFVLLYLLFLLFLGFPVMVMELSIGRAGRSTLVDAYGRLAAERKGTWRILGGLFFSGNLILLMFYSTVAGWMPAYAYRIGSGAMHGKSAAGIAEAFGQFVTSPGEMIGWMMLVVLVSTLICSAGLRRGVEKSVKWMMGLLFLMLLLLCIQSLLLPGAWEGVKFYLMPSFGKMAEAGFGSVILAAMGQAFFTLSLGIGAMAIFGSYTGKEQSLAGESWSIIGLDTATALLAGIVIFPACASFGVDAAAGPGLVFITLPNIFNQMPWGRLWGVAFFIFMTFAALTTVVAVQENLIALVMEKFHRRRTVAAGIVGAILILTSLPCALSFNFWREVRFFGLNILDFEDFLLSDNLLVLGSLSMVIFCVWRRGWGWDRFIEEANTGRGMRFPRGLRNYARFVIPPVILLIFIFGYLNRFGWEFR